MAPLLQRKLIVVAGKGGVGKSTIAGALGLLAARHGIRTIVVEVGERQHLPVLLEQPPAPHSGVEVQLMQELWSLSIDPDRVLADWLKALGGRVSARVLLSSSTFQYFVAAAPGAREMLSMVKVWGLTGAGGTKYDRERRGGGKPYDLVILDAPATGHALALLSSPRTFAGLARVGPIAVQAREVGELLRDPRRSGFLAVTQGSEMAVSETLQLQVGLREELGRELDTVVFNAALPRRFDEQELLRIAAVDSSHPTGRAAAHAAKAVHERARLQNNQLARLRRRKLPLVRVPFVFQARLDAAALQSIADRLERGLL
jgi:anion-transporting  ArsA/GET3 family ATPase